MFFLDQGDHELEITGWLPEIKAKAKRLTPEDALAFEAGANQAATSPLNTKPEPTEGQKKSGRYAKGHVDFQGIRISIENPRGSVRAGVDRDGQPWSITMSHHYGFVERTAGADGEGVDVFVGPDLDSDLVVIVNQVEPTTGKFDEHKVMLGFSSEQAARDGYMASYTPGWKGLGSTVTCDVDDFKEWLETGDLQHPATRDVSTADGSWLDTIAGTFRRGIAKAGFGEAGAGGVRWITIHPHGKDEPGHPVQIRPVQGHEGVYHVVGGADGKLNGLRLQNIKSPEHYKSESKARAKEIKKAREAKRKAQEAVLTDEEKGQRQVSESEAKDRVKQAEEKLVRTTLQAQGLDPDEVMALPTDDKLAQAKHRREVLTHALKTAKEAERRITLDAEARAAAGIATLGGDHQPSADDLLTVKDTEHGPGYQRALKEKAQEAGLTAGKLADIVDGLKRQQAEERVSEGDFTEGHVKLGGGDPVVGIQIAGAKMGEAIREAHMKAKQIKALHDGAIKESLKQAVTENAQLADILRARKELREAQKALKRGKETLFESGYQTRIENLDEAIIQDAEDAIRTNRMQGFLDEVEEAHPDDSDTLDLAQVPNEDGLHACRGAGAFDALHEVALASLGQGALDRETVEVLGPDGGAILLARALRRVYRPEEQKEILAALEEVHLEEQDQELPQVVEEAKQLREDARKVQEELSGTPRDLATASQMQRNKVALLKDARRRLGGTLGRMEARAALLQALKETPREVLNVPLGKVTREQAVITAAALGLQAGDYSLDYEKGEGLLTLHPEGQDRLIRPYDQTAAAEREIAMSIKRGQMDEDGWLPTGFARRAELTSDDPLREPVMFRQPFQAEGVQTSEDLRGAVEDYIGARYADGDRATDILMSLNNAEAMQQVPEHLREAFGETVRNALPLREEVLDEKGQPIQDKDEETGQMVPRTRAARADIIDGAAQRMAEGFFKRHGLPGDKAFYAQRAAGDSPEFSEAIHQALAKDPRTQAAFIPQGELTTEHQRHLRDYFYESLLGQSAKAQDRDRAAHEAALRDAGPEPEKESMDLFGEVSTSPEWQEWKQRVDNLAGTGKDGERPGSPWGQFVESMGGLKDAQKAVQDHMAGRFLDHFAGHYERATGQKFKRGQAQIHQSEAFLKAAGTPEEREQARAERQAETEALRKRDTTGRYDAGSINERRDEMRERGATAQAEAGGLFDMGEFNEQQAVGDAQQDAPAPFGLKAGHRLSLGPAIEAQLRQAMPNALRSMQGQSRGVDLRPVSMSGRFVAQQRLAKAITHLKKVGIFAGAGSGKTAIMLGAHAELAKSDKVKKAIYAVPSAVQDQFGGEAASFLDPKSGLYIHANPGETFEARLKAYQDPEVHGVVVTHQGLRDDTLKVLGDHKGMKDHAALTAWIHAAPRAELAQAVKDAWHAAGVDPDALFVDEGHNALNRAGKEDSTLAKIVDAMGDNAGYYAAATADPIKNSPDEAFDWLSKFDPKRYPAEGRAEFMRRYGQNTALCRRSLKAELARYYFTARVDPGVAAHHETITAPLTEHQKAALEELDQASARLRYAKTPEERAQWAAKIDPNAAPEDVLKAIGTFKETGYNRILNMDAEGGKVKTTVDLAQKSVAEGKPAIIFARNLDAVDAIAKAMEAAGVKAVTLTGKDSSSDKAAKVRRFQPKGGLEPEAHVIVLSDAGATGINLQRGQTVIHHDIPMTHMTHSQRTARAWRLGQKHDVQVYTVAADHAYDHANLQRLARKSSLAGIFKSSEGFLDDTGTAERLRAIRERKNQVNEPAAA